MPKSEEEITDTALETINLLQEMKWTPPEVAIMLLKALELLHSPIPGFEKKTFSDFLQESAIFYKSIGK